MRKRTDAIKAVQVAASRAEAKHGLKWCGSPYVTHEQRLYIVMTEMHEVEDAVVKGDEVRLKEELLDVMGAMLGWLEVLG